MSTVITLTKCKLNTYVTSRKATAQHSTTLKQRRSHLNAVQMLPRIFYAVSHGQMNIYGTLLPTVQCTNLEINPNSPSEKSQTFHTKCIGWSISA
jgi:hypothetical protein